MALSSAFTPLSSTTAVMFLLHLAKNNHTVTITVPALLSKYTWDPPSWARSIEGNRRVGKHYPVGEVRWRTESDGVVPPGFTQPIHLLMSALSKGSHIVGPFWQEIKMPVGRKAVVQRVGQARKRHCGRRQLSDHEKRKIIILN